MKKKLDSNILFLELLKTSLFVALLILISPTVKAEVNENIAIPATAKYITTYKNQVNGINQIRIFSDTSFSMLKCTGSIDALKNGLTSEENVNELQLDKCANIYIKYERCDNDFTLCASAYCEERTPSQQALAAAAKQCSLQFTPECFQLLPKFDSLKRQNIIQVNKNVCDEF